MNCVRVCFVNVSEIEKKLSLKRSYSEKSQRIARYLIILIWFNEMNRKIFRKFKSWALQFLIRDKQLFKRVNKNVFFKRIVDEIKDQQKILKQLHDEDGHKNWKNIYWRVTDRYWWRNLYKDCERYVVNCNVCQRKKFDKKKETLHFTWMSASFKKIDINYEHMSASKVMKAMMIVWNDLIEWIKACALFNFKINTIVKFMWQDVINRHKCFDIAILNEDFENKKIIKQLLQRYRVKIKIVSSYHSMINDMIKWDHQFIVDALSKLTDDKFKMWFQHLHAILWINWTIMRDSTNIVSFRLFYEWDVVLLIEIEYFIWYMMDWSKI